LQHLTILQKDVVNLHLDASDCRRVDRPRVPKLFPRVSQDDFHHSEAEPYIETRIVTIRAMWSTLHTPSADLVYLLSLRHYVVDVVSDIPQGYDVHGGQRHSFATRQRLSSQYHGSV